MLGGATGWDITNVEVQKINEENGESTYRATYNDLYIDDSISEEHSCDFKIKKVDVEYRISATNYCDIDRQEEKNETNDNLNKELSYESINLTEGYLVKVYENKNVTVQFDNRIYKAINEPDGSGEMQMQIEYKIIGYKGQVKDVYVLQARGTWPAIVVINQNGDLYIGKTNNMRYNTEEKTAIVSKCSIGNVKRIEEKKDEYMRVTTNQTENYTISWETLSDFELINKAKEEAERKYKVMLNTSPVVVRYSSNSEVDGRTATDIFTMDFPSERYRVIRIYSKKQYYRRI